MSRIAAAIWFAIAFGCAPPRVQTGQGVRLVYVSPTGSDAASGTLAAPLATLPRAQAKVRDLKKERGGAVEVVLREGTYFLAEPLVFGPADGGSAQGAVTYRVQPRETAVLSGGRRISGWERVEGDLWKTNLPEVKSGQWFFRQLFVGNERKTRARTPNHGFFFTEGPLAEYAGMIRKWDFPTRHQLWNNNIEAFTGFRYKPGDVPAIPDFANAEVVTHHSWESSWQTIRKIDPQRNQLYFNTPSWCPIGFFGQGSEHLRYRIENYLGALDEPGEWFLDRQTGELYYKALAGEDVPRMPFIAPYLTNLISFAGEPDQGPKVTHLHLQGLRFHHVAYRMGVYLNSGHELVNGASKALPWENVTWDAFVRQHRPDWPAAYGPGYMEPQAVLTSGEAILFTNSQSCSVTGSEIAHMGGYGVSIGEGCKDIRLQDNHIHDGGSGGIKVGLPVLDVEAENLAISRVPSGNQITNNKIHNLGIVHPGSVGIWIAQTTDNEVAHNHLFDLPYSAISMGWTWGSRPTYTHRNRIAFNHIHDVLQLLTDGGGIYTLGQLDGSRIEGNHLYRIRRAPGAVGSHSNGIFFDEGSQKLSVTGNIIHDIENAPIRFNSSFPRQMVIKGNYFEVDSLEVKAEQVLPTTTGPGLIRVVLPDNHFGIGPESTAFPKKAAAKAGVK